MQASIPLRVSSFTPVRYSPLELWHLLSLDAPTVAAVWTVFVARASDVHIGYMLPLAMFVAVWIIYATDRLLDSRGSRAGSLNPCHRFHNNHWKAFVAVLAIISITLTALLFRFNPGLLRAYVPLALALLLWFVVVHTRGRTQLRLPKELAVGLFFSAAIFAPVLVTSGSRAFAVLPSALLFAATCTLNCLYLHHWENSFKGAHWMTRLVLPHLHTLSVVVATNGAMISFVSLKQLRSSQLWAVAIACSISALIMLLLDLKRHRLEALQLRVAIDLALLTPCLFLAMHLRNR